MAIFARIPWWTWTWPLLAIVILLLHFLFSASLVIALLQALALIATVFAAVYHAELVAHGIGEPLGTLILAIVVTIIEVALILSVMIRGGADTTGWRATWCSQRS